MKLEYNNRESELGKPHLKKTYSEFSPTLNNIQTRAITESDYLPTLPHDEYGNKMANILNNYQVKSNELVRIAEMADNDYSKIIKQRKADLAQRKKETILEGDPQERKRLATLVKKSVIPSLLIDATKALRTDENLKSDDQEPWKEQLYSKGIKVSIDFGEFMTSEDSKNILSGNKEIIGNILKYSFDRQIYKTENEINKINNMKKFIVSNKYLKVKISNVKPKIQEEIKPEETGVLNTEQNSKKYYIIKYFS